MLTVRKALPTDFDVIQEIFRYARSFMKSVGNPTQWKDDRPGQELTKNDIECGNAYVVCDSEKQNKTVGTFAFILGEDPTYKVIDGAWLSDAPYGTIHRVAAAEGTHGIMSTVLKFCRDFSIDLRIDTHKDNAPMRHQIEKNGFVCCGIIWVDDGTERLAYQWQNNR